MLRDRKAILVRPCHIVHVGEILWRPSFHAKCLPQGVNMYVQTVRKHLERQCLDAKAQTQTRAPEQLLRPRQH